MSFLGFSGLFCAVTSILLGIFVYTRNRTGKQNQAYFWLSFGVFIYGLPYYLWQTADNVILATIYFKFLIAGIIVLNLFYLMYVFTMLDIINTKRVFLFLNIMLCCVFLYLNYCSLFYKSFTLRPGFGYWPTATLLTSIYILFWHFQAGYGLHCMVKTLQQDIPMLKRQQIKYFALAAAIGYLGGSSNWPMWYGKFPYLPYLNILIVLYVSIVAYTIIRYKLMDIEVIIKKTLVFTSMFIVVLGVFVGITLLTQELLAGGRIIGLAISSIIIILAVRPLEEFLTKITDKFLFQRKYNPTELIKTFTDKVITVLDLDRLTRTTVATLASTLNLNSVSILLLDKNENNYDLHDSVGPVNQNINLGVNTKIAQYLSKTGSVLFKKDAGDEGLLEEMKRLDAELILPLIMQKLMIGIIILGKKKSDQEYATEDIDILTALAKAEAIALSNARLFAEAKQNVKLAAIGALSAGINHEVCNPLNRMMSSMQIYLKSKAMGLFKDKPDKEIISMGDEIMLNTMKEIRGIANITKKLSDFAKPGRDAVAERLNIEDSLQSTLDVLGHDIELKRIEFIKVITGPLYIMADRDQMQEVFFNIIRNAVQAIGEGGRITFKAEKTDSLIEVSISDAGHGIPEDKIGKIFTPFYTTKKEGEGTGLGLAIVQQLIFKNKGIIRVNSEVGKGTTFTLTFPEAKNA